MWRCFSALELLLLPTLGLAFRLAEDSARYPQAESNANFTVLVNTFRRHDCLAKVLQHWLSCDPGELRVTWSEGAHDVPAWLLSLEREGKVVIDRYPTNRLTNRFQPQSFAHDAVFTVDDDITYSCSALHGAFRTFRRDPLRITGFAARQLAASGYQHGSAFKDLKANTLFVTKGAFVPNWLFLEYHSEQYAKQREFVDKHTTAEDILMSFVYARKVGLPVVPLVVEQRQVQKLWPCGGPLGRQLMTRPGNSKLRQGFIASLFDTFGDPLGAVETSAFTDVNTNDVINMTTSRFIDVTGGHKEMRRGGKDYLVI